MLEIGIHIQYLLMRIYLGCHNPETGLLTGTPDDEHVGVYNITFSVEDAAGAVGV